MTIKYLENELKNKRKDFGKYFFLSMSILFFVYFLLTISFEEYRILLKDYKEFYFIGSLSSAYICYLISKLEYDFVILHRTLLIFIVLIIVYLCLLHCYLSYTVYSYYIPITIFIGMVTKKRIGFIFGIVFIVLCIFTRALALKYGFSSPMNIPPDLVIMRVVIEVITLCISAYFSLFLIYYNNQFQKIEFARLSLKYNADFGINREGVHFNTNDDLARFEQLYSEIINMLNTEKSYRDPKFSKVILAERLNTNGSYISKALSLNGSKNFNKLVNEYRVNQVKEDLINKNFQNFTLEHLYIKAGFTQQSTFNRVFKEIAGITPSEFIEAIEDKEIDDKG